MKQVAHGGVFGDDGVYRRLGCLDEHAQTQRGVAKIFAIVQRLHRQANTQVAAVAFKHPHIATDHVVQHLVAAAIARVVNGAGVILQVDPVRHHHRCGHDQFEHAKAGVALPLVIVQKAAACQVEVAAAAAGRNNEGGAVGQAPFGPHLSPVGGAIFDGFAQFIRLGSQRGQAKRGGTLGTGALPGIF